MSSPDHTFFATAFVENFPLKEMAVHYPEAKRTPRELWFSPASGGTVFLYPFGALVFFDVGPEAREAELARLHRIRLEQAHLGHLHTREALRAEMNLLFLGGKAVPSRRGLGRRRLDGDQLGRGRGRLEHGSPGGGRHLGEQLQGGALHASPRI